MEKGPGTGVSRELGPHLGTGEGIAEGVGRRRGSGSTGGGGLTNSQAGLKAFVVGINLEALLVSRNGVVVVSQAVVSGSKAAVGLDPIGLKLDGLFSVGQGFGVFMEVGVGGGSVGVEDVVGRSESDGVSEVGNGGVKVAGRVGGVALGFGFVGHG